MNLILVFAHRRTDLLSSCLDRLLTCDGIREHEVLVVEDTNRRTCRESVDVRKMIVHKRPYFLHFRHMRNYDTKNAWDNQLAGIQQALLTRTAELVYLIEDDVMVAPDFLKWSEMAHNFFHPFATVGVNVFSKLGNDPKAVNLSSHEYAHWGVCMPRQNLLPALTHWERHPEESFHNYILKNKEEVIYPQMPRAINVGMPKGQTVDFSYSPAKHLYIGDDRSDLWRAAHDKQAPFGF